MRIYTFITILLCSYNPVFAQTPPALYVNELMASNSTTIADGTFNYEDWFEIYNAESFAINLNGYYLSDDTSNLTKFQIVHNITIAANGFALFWASGDTSRGQSHVDFALSAQGEAVIITAPDGITVIDSIVFGLQTTDISKGRSTDGNQNWMYFTSPTPNASNNTSGGYSAILSPPQFSQNAGFYPNGFTLTLSTADTGATIYYTLDGSKPDPSKVNGFGYTYKNQYRQFPATPPTPFLHDTIRTFVYNSPIQIDNRTPDTNRTSSKSSTFNLHPDYIPDTLMQKGTVVRAIAVRQGAIPSKIVTNTYFVGSDLQNRYTLPVFSISMDENLLFGYYDCFYCAGEDFEDWRSSSNGSAQGNSPANWHNSGRAYEYPMSLEYFETSGQRAFGEDVGARIHGGWSRARRRKTFRIYARSEYGNSTIDYPLFTRRPHAEYKRFLLRNSGNDESQTIFRDAAIQSLVNHLNFEIQQSDASVIFINGEYFGINNIREFQNRHYINRMYGLDRTEIDFLGPYRAANDGDAAHFASMINYINFNNLTNDSLFKEVTRRLDIIGFTDYTIAQIYARNTDWPVANIKYWRKRVPFDPNAPEGHDGRWRYLMYDTDFGFGRATGPGEASHNTLVHTRNNGDIGLILRNCWDNVNYKNYFVNRYADLINTCFLPSHIEHVFDSVKAIYAPEMPEHIARWGVPESYSDWEDEIQVMLDFAEDRPAFARMHIMSYFNLPHNWNVTLDVSDTLAGYVRINTIPILETTVGVPVSPYPWEGIYFENVPIELEAIANPGYRFSHWEIGPLTELDDTIYISLSSDTFAIAHFTPDTGIVCGPATHLLANCPYIFDEWSSTANAGSFPDHMQFVYFNEDDPSDSAIIAGETSGAYNLNNRTRIIGLDSEGLALINTGNIQGNPGYPGTRLGGLVLNLNTENMNRGYVQWVGGTLEPQSRYYHLKLQYRLGSTGPWEDFLDSNGNPIEYKRNANFNHSEILGPHEMPTILMGRTCIQLMWRYYFTGQGSGARDFLRIDDIIVAEGQTPSQPVSITDVTSSSSINGKSVVLGGETTNYSIQPLAGATYDWHVINGIITSGQGTPQINVEWAQSGVGNITVELLDTYNCNRKSTKTVNISGLSTKSENSDPIELYPNPNNGKFLIELNDKWNEEVNMSIIDGSGKVVEIHTLSPGKKHEIETKIAPGQYHVQLFSDEGRVLFNQRIRIIR